MLALHAIQAQFGDCLLVEFGPAADPRFLLVDGGPPDNYGPHLEQELRRVAAAGGRLELVVLSHVDNDHVIGLLDLVAQLREQRANDQPETIGIGGLWHNSFARALDPDGEIAPRLQALLANAGGVQAMGQTGIAVAGIAQGSSLRLAAEALGVPVNDGFPNDLICTDDAQPVAIENLRLTVVGPTRANLDELKAKWEEWLDKHEDVLPDAAPHVAAMADRSVPNLSSIMLLAEADGKRMLLTGDGRGDHLLAGLDKAGALDAEGAIHVDVLKLAHHGSDRNTTRAFFRRVTADTYVVSADGTNGNPDLATLIWLVEAAKEQNRPIKVLATNATPSTGKLLEQYPPAEYGYELTTMPPEQNSITVSLA